MIVIPHTIPDLTARRTHPWTVTEYVEGGGEYHDFKLHPDLVSEVLEDFVVYSQQPAIQRFYDFVKWLNRPGGRFESNDCAFRGPASHQDVIFRWPLRASGRIEIFFRELIQNTSQDCVMWLVRMFHLYLSLKDRDVENVIFATSLNLTDFLGIQSVGNRLSVRFQVYGEDEEAVFVSLDLAVKCLHHTLERIEIALQTPIPAYP
jgi:hypothetical protein